MRHVQDEPMSDTVRKICSLEAESNKIKEEEVKSYIKLLRATEKDLGSPNGTLGLVWGVRSSVWWD